MVSDLVFGGGYDWVCADVVGESAPCKRGLKIRVYGSRFRVLSVSSLMRHAMCTREQNHYYHHSFTRTLFLTERPAIAVPRDLHGGRSEAQNLHAGK